MQHVEGGPLSYNSFLANALLDDLLKDSGCVLGVLVIRLLEPGNKVMQQQPVCTHLLSLIRNIFCLVEKRCTCNAIQDSTQA